MVPERPIRQMPFPRLTYREAIDRYGSDKPDLRFGMELHDLGELAAGSGFGVFEEASQRRARGRLAAPGHGRRSRIVGRRADRVGEAGRRRGPGLDRGRVGRRIRSSIVKVLGEERAEAMAEAAGASPGDLVLIVADRDIDAQEALGEVRVEIGARLGLADPDELAYCWVHRFPMYQWDADNGRWDATHNPFSARPRGRGAARDGVGRSDAARPDDPAGRARALQYDLALNGWELAAARPLPPASCCRARSR